MLIKEYNTRLTAHVSDDDDMLVSPLMNSVDCNYFLQLGRSH